MTSFIHKILIYGNNVPNAMEISFKVVKYILDRRAVFKSVNSFINSIKKTPTVATWNVNIAKEGRYIMHCIGLLELGER